MMASFMCLTPCRRCAVRYCTVSAFPLLVVPAEGWLRMMYAIISQFTYLFKFFALYILVFVCYNVRIEKDACGN